MVKKKRRVKSNDNNNDSFSNVDALDTITFDGVQEATVNDEFNDEREELPDIPVSATETNNTEETVLTHRSLSKSVISTEHDVDIQEVMNKLTRVDNEEREPSKMIDCSNFENNALTKRSVCNWLVSLLELIPLPASVCRVSIATTVSIMIVLNIEGLSLGWL